MSKKVSGKRVLVTGANGFLGSHIVDALLARGDKVRAMVRPKSDLSWLDGKNVEIVLGELDRPDSLAAAVKGVDAIIHNAGVISEKDPYLYHLYNSEGTRRLAEATLEHTPSMSRVVYVSSQAAGGPTRGYRPMTETDDPRPITAYGQSKLLAEKQLLAMKDQLPITIIRPPALYGPRDRAWLTLFKLVARGWLPLIGKYKSLTLTHGMDTAAQILLQLDHENALGEIFYNAPFEPITFEDFGKSIAKVLRTEPRIIVIDDWVLRYIYPLTIPILKMLNIRLPFKKDKMADVFADRWTISGQKAKDLLGFEGKFPASAGTGQTAEWYRWKKWLETSRDRAKHDGKAITSHRFENGKRRAYHPGCDLCGLAFDGEILTKRHYEDTKFIIVDCMICGVPMAVLKEHRSTFSEDERKDLLAILHENFGSDGFADFEQRRIPEHAHVHYRHEPHIDTLKKRPK